MDRKKLIELKQESAKTPLPIEVFEDGNFKLEVAISTKESTVWLTQEQIAKLFEVDRSNVTLYKENYMELHNTVLRLENKVINHDERISNLESENKQKLLAEKIFYQGEFYDSYSFLINLIKRANKSITLIDNYIDIKTLDILSNIN